MPDRLDANDFIQQIRVSQRFALRVLDGELELRLIDSQGDAFQYQGPALDIGDDDSLESYGRFINELSSVTTSLEIARKRYRGWDYW